MIWLCFPWVEGLSEISSLSSQGRDKVAYILSSLNSTCGSTLDLLLFVIGLRVYKRPPKAATIDTVKNLYGYINVVVAYNTQHLLLLKNIKSTIKSQKEIVWIHTTYCMQDRKSKSHTS